VDGHQLISKEFVTGECKRIGSIFVDITVPILAGLSLKLSDLASNHNKYPTARLQKGILLLQDGQELTEEGVGFGVPVLKRGIQTIFPGQFELSSRNKGSIQEVTARFKMNLEEKIGRPGFGNVESEWVYTIKNSLAAIIRRFPWLRGLLTTASNVLRRLFRWETTFEEAGYCTLVDVLYTIDSQSGLIIIEVDTTDLSVEGITEVVVMNEQGARIFDQYRDSNGTLQQEKEIGCWDEVTAEWASFVSESHGLVFTLRQLNGARLYRGRELVGSRLAWSGFGYSFPPSFGKISYEVNIERL
jgi:hypothetical protein